MDRADDATLEVRSVLLPLLGDSRLLLPHASLSEVVGYRPPEQVPEGSPEWLLGMMTWRQYKVPVILFDALLQDAGQKIGHRARLAICNTLNGDPARPYMAIVLRTVPQLVRVTESLIEPLDDEDADTDMMVLERVRLNDKVAWIPDLDALEKAVSGIIDQ